jgi:hypothetical protein
MSMPTKTKQEMTIPELIKRLREKQDMAITMKWNAYEVGKTSRKWYWDGQQDAISEILDLLK